MDNKDFIRQPIDKQEYDNALSKFKVGDRVRLLKYEDMCVTGWNNEWLGEMDELVGYEGIICGIGNHRTGVYIEFDPTNRDTGYGYPPQALIKIG